MKTIYRQDAGRITVLEAKHMIVEASAIDPRVDVSEELRQHASAPSHLPKMPGTGVAKLSGLEIESNFARLCGQLLIEPHHRWRSIPERYEPDSTQDAVFTISHAEFLQLVELHGGTVEVSLAPQATTQTALSLTEAESKVQMVVWYDSVLRAYVWRKLPVVKATDAALLLCEFSPALTTVMDVIAEKISNSQVSYVDLATMCSAFESLSETPRSLADWRLVAEALELRHHKWLKQYEGVLELLDPSNTPARSRPAVKPAVLYEQRASGPIPTKPHTAGTAGDTPSATEGTHLWRLKTTFRANSLRSALHRHLKGADKTKPRPSARDVMEAWLAELPTGIIKVLADQVDYISEKPDGVLSATKKQIQDRILAMTELLEV